MKRRSWTPGRVNLMGEWIDFNGGLVLPAALPLGVDISLEAISGREDRVSSEQYGDTAVAPLDVVATGHWADYVFGAVQAARKRGWLEGAASVHLDSKIPVGAGVSSSAAVTVGVLRAAAPDGVASTDLATLARSVENEFIGVPCGIMDQMAVAHGNPGQAIALDTDSLAFEQISLPVDWKFTVIHSGVERRLADGQYKQRRDACLEAARLLGVEALCSADDISNLPTELALIAKHVISENRRTIAARDAMLSSDLDAMGRLITQSHYSLRDDFKVSTPEVDSLVETALDCGAAGARITGAGFGGCIVALLADVDPRKWRERVFSKNPAAYWICAVENAAR